MFVSAYVMLPFHEVCRVLDQSRPTVPHLRATGSLRWSSKAAAAMAIEWADPSSPADWRPGEVRVIGVQSGAPPMTEMVLVAPSPAGPHQARLVLDGLIKAVEGTLPGASSAGPPLAVEAVPNG